jgi:hypothetical protein
LVARFMSAIGTKRTFSAVNSPTDKGPGYRNSDECPYGPNNMPDRIEAAFLSVAVPFRQRAQIMRLCEAFLAHGHARHALLDKPVGVKRGDIGRINDRR